MSSYDEFAPYFDDWQRAFGGSYDELILPRVLALLARHAPEASRVVDLGIGTGDLAIALARRGFAVIGVDVSRPMLTVAGAKIAAARLRHPPELLEQDIRTLVLVAPTDAAVCVYTVINQLTGDGDLERLCAAVHASLVPGGVFVFEVNLPPAYERWWTGDDEVSAGGVRVVRSHRRDPASGLIEAAVTITGTDGIAQHDRIVQRPYTEDAIETAVRRAGFAVLGRDDYDPFAGGASPTKALWTVQRLRA